MERRVFVSVNSDRSLDSRRQALKRAILARLTSAGFSPQIFFESGLPQTLSWTFEHVNSVMLRCVGAIVIGFPRWRTTTSDGTAIRLVGEFLQYEGAVALAYGRPTLLAAEVGVEGRGIVYQGAGRAIAPIPADATPETLFSAEFGRAFEAWIAEMRERPDVFLGYCSQSSGIAAQIQLRLERAGAAVHNWAMDFQYGRSILEEIEQARDLCSRGIFVFSEDDPLAGSEGMAAPRDNVVFEAGFFIGTKGAKNCLIIRIGNAKMPADLGGAIYLGLAAGEDVSHIESRLQQFVNASIQ